MKNPSASHDERQSAASRFSLLPVLLCLAVVLATAIGVTVFALSRDVLTATGISGVVVGAGAALSWWIAPHLN